MKKFVTNFKLKMSENNEAKTDRSRTSSTLTNSSDNQAPKSDMTIERQVLNELSSEMLKSTADYIESEVALCTADYVTLEKMNRAVEAKYTNFSDISSNISQEMGKLNETYATLMPMLAQIDDLEGCIGQLEKSANKLDDYSKKLELRYKQIQDKYSNK